MSSEKLKYKNYIFDLYGTLIDIRTDENEKEFWQFLSEIYSCYGADYTAKELQNTYLEMVHEEESLLSYESGSGSPEIRLEKVFVRLLKEAPRKHKTRSNIMEKSAESLMESEWVDLIANVFRVRSRKEIRLYDGVYDVLKFIRDNGGKVYLLSNAQGVFTIPEMEIFGLTGYFDKMYISSEQGIKKPQGEFLLRLMEEEGLSREDSVMIGNDIESDIGVALKAGIDSIYLNTYDMEDTEIEMHTAHVMKGMDNGLAPRIIADGDIRKILKL